MKRVQHSIKKKPVVESQDGQVVTTTLEVAKFFGRHHYNVMQAVNRLSKEVPEEFFHLNFQPGFYTLPETKEQQHQQYTLTRDGFVMLVMGFTGKEAIRFKIAYIKAFNAMEAELLKDKIRVNSLSQALEQLYPTPTYEESSIRNQRCIKVLRAMIAYWAILDDISLKAAESAVCAVGKLEKLEDYNFVNEIKPGDQMVDFLYRLINNSNSDTQPATEEQKTAIKYMIDACDQFKYSRDVNIYDILKEDCNISVENFVNMTSGEAKRISHLLFRTLHTHIAKTSTIIEIKKKTKTSGNRYDDWLI